MSTSSGSPAENPPEQTAETSQEGTAPSPAGSPKGSAAPSPAGSPKGSGASPAKSSTAESTSEQPSASATSQKSSLGPSASSKLTEKVTKLHCPACEDDEDIAFGGRLNESQIGKTDNVNTEFLYYSATIREVAPSLTSDLDRQLIIPWIRKLFRPEYHSSRFRDKRNQFLLHLTLTIMNDEAYGIFHVAPPCGALPLYASLEPQDPFPKAEWELDTMWQDVLQGLPDDKRQMECSIHANKKSCSDDHSLEKFLDEEFSYYLYLARPYAVVLRSTEDRTKVATWLQALCTIHQYSCCCMKRLRNEYIVALLGYISDLRVAGPFMQYPTWNPLPPLSELAKLIADNPPVIDPCSSEASEFLVAQPIPDEGAFCYIAITGDILDSSLNELD